MGWAIADVPGSGSLVYYDDAQGVKVTLTDFVVYVVYVQSAIASRNGIDIVQTREPGGRLAIASPDGRIGAGAVFHAVIRDDRSGLEGHGESAPLGSPPPPVLLSPGGMVDAPVRLEMAGPPGAEILYTLDGSDPPRPGGAVSPSARLSEGAILVAPETNVEARARIPIGVGLWSEPARAAFRARWGQAGIAVAGQYEGSLSDRGERIWIVDAGGDTILEFTYRASWYPEASGGGRSPGGFPAARTLRVRGAGRRGRGGARSRNGKRRVRGYYGVPSEVGGKGLPG
ncbi:MAG: chitobiase/beta-hexosaminidase C-terminal domain-containing protein [Planctomycetota bacterium]